MKFHSPTPQALKILKFLRVETCTAPEIIQILLEQGTVQASYQILNRMVTLKFLTKATISVVSGRAVLLYGITNHGLAYAWDLTEVVEKRPTFQPSKISLFTLQHRLDIHKIHVFTEQAGWTNWRDGSQLGFRRREQKVPDAVAVSTANEMVAFEIEREIKSSKKYRQIIVSHLMSRKKGYWSFIFYLCPSQDMAMRLKRKFEMLGSVDFNGKKIQLTTEHLQHFEFFGYDEFIKKMEISFNETPLAKNIFQTIK
jgi:DNA-binding PadR family transcriptional regulator